MTERPAPPAGIMPPGWPSPERLAEIMEEIRRRIEEYRAEFERRDEGKDDG